MKQQRNTRYRAWTWALILVTGLGLGLMRGTRRMQAAPPPPPPNTLVVTNTTDNDPGSLRQAIAAAQSGDTITFAANVTGEIALSSGQLEINKNLTIQGPGAQVLTLRNTKAASTTSRVLVVHSGATANVSGLTFTGGRPNGTGFGCGSITCGGGINNAGSLTLTHCVVTGNSLGSDSAGGGIFTSGPLTLVNSTVANNSLSGGSNNFGGGIYNYGGTIHLLNSTVSGNTVSGGSANKGGGIYNGGTLWLTNSTISSNHVSGGSFSQGGGIFYSGGFILATNCTITGNSASGGGVGNDGGGVNGPFTARNTLIAGNTVSGSQPQAPDVRGTLTSQGNNLLGNNANTTITPTTGDQIGTPTNPINPKLDDLGNYGGPTQTHRPQFDSPAVNAGANAGAPATDQRGYGRPANGGTVDIGAVERGANDGLTPPVTETNGEITLTRDPATDGGRQELIAALEVANDNPAPTTIRLVCGTYSYATAHNWEFGPNALPIIRSPITLEGNGAVLNATNATRLRFFYVAGNGVGGLTPGTLTLQNGKQKGGDSSSGGGGAGMGGAIFNHGQVTLERVTLMGNTAAGGSGGISNTQSGGGGGMGQDAQGLNGGGFGGTPTGSGGAGGAGVNGGGSGGGGGFLPGSNGGNASGNNGGAGSGSGKLGGGGGVGFDSAGFDSAGGTAADGGGGGGGFGRGFGGSFGFSGASRGGGGGVGGGGGANSFATDFDGGGGGGGLGGTLFNHQGTLTLINCTLTANTATGGNGANGGSGFGGALFNLNGSVTITSSTLAANTVTAGTGGSGAQANGGAIYNLAYGNDFTSGGTTTAQVILRNSILANSTGGSDLVNDQRDSTTNPAIGAGDNTATVDYGERNLVRTAAALSNTSLTGSLYSSADPNLGALQTNDCKPAVLPLLAGSPAIDAATDAAPDTDQLGTTRPQGAASDLGAFEVPVSNTAPTITVTNLTRTAGSPAGNFSIANVNDAEDAENTLSVTASPLMGSGVTVNSISVSSTGNVTANVAAACGATTSTFTLRVTDSGGFFKEATLQVTVNPETTPPTINPISNVVVSLPLNSPATSMVVNFPLPTATDNCTANPTVTTNPASGAVFPVGTTTVTVKAKDAAMNEATTTFTVTVRYNFGGFFQPVDNLPIVNTVNAGQSIPVKFSLSGNKGLSIFAAGFPQSAQIPCSGGAASDIEETVTAGASSLSYDATSDRYNYVWKTDKAWKGTCRKLIVRFNDGTTREAIFQFK